ncbi:MAG: hypothetical protein WDO15_29360 [Bacteroidota bacterium]
MRHSFYKISFLLSSFLLSGLVAFAQSAIPEVVRVDEYGRSLHEGKGPEAITWQTMTVGTLQPVFDTCLPGEYYVGLQLFYDFGDLLTSDWTTQAQVSITKNGVSQLDGTLQIQNSGQAAVNQNVSSTLFYDQKINCHGSDVWQYKVTAKTPTGTVPATHVRLKVVLFRAHDDFLPGAPVTLTAAANASAQQTILHWDEVTGATEYELEWMFIEKNEGSFPAPDCATAFDPKKGGAGITTTETTFTHQWSYPDGEIWYRVRPVGYLNNNKDHRILGQWHNCVTKVAVVNLTSGMPSNITWQAQTLFAEDGKFKNIVTYYDATSRERQSRTNLSSNNTTIVGESMYDFEGRPSIQMLPVPIQNATNQNPLAYASNFHDFNTPSAVATQMNSFVGTTKKKFFYDNGSLQNGTVKTTTGAGKYYSATNDFLSSMANSPLRDYIPDANGYVFSQTEYERDGTSKVLREGGVGANFTVDGGNHSHAVRHYYTQATTYELTRIFGTNVGNAAHYKKKVTVDNNQQVSVAYLDQEGRGSGNSSCRRSYQRFSAGSNPY